MSQENLHEVANSFHNVRSPFRSQLGSWLSGIVEARNGLVAIMSNEVRLRLSSADIRHPRSKTLW